MNDKERARILREALEFCKAECGEGCDPYETIPDYVDEVLEETK